MDKTCKNCNSKFEITEIDLAFYETISPIYNNQKYLIPPPTLCPDCRQQRRIVWRNERGLYSRNCDKTGKKMLAMYDPNLPFPVYDNDVWWGDSWDARDYGRDFDFNREFFPQLMELHDKVPHFALAVAKTTMENSDYCNHAGYLKNCYLIYNSDYSESCMYSKGVNRCFDCLDCLKIYDCQACYECINSYNCQFSSYLWDSYNSSDCHFGYNLIGCKNCFLCINLRNQEYVFQNQKYSKDEYHEKVRQFRLEKDNEEIAKLLAQAKEKMPVKRIVENNTENCSGDYLSNCKNCTNCFDCEYLENSKYCYDLKKGDGISFENYDLSAFGVGVVRSYEGGSIGYNSNHCLFTENVWQSFDVHYSMLCMNNCKNCFGCIGLKKAEHCILNKQYTREEYEKLVPEIIHNMQKTGEWGEFFPMKDSPFAYNETMAQEYFTLTRDEALSKDLKWLEKDQKEYQKQIYEVPHDISEVNDDICNEILACKESGRNFKIQKSELAFYRKFSLPIPKYCPDIRHLHRLGLKNPRKLHELNCSKCGTKITTSYTAKRPTPVLCENCYLNQI